MKTNSFILNNVINDRKKNKRQRAIWNILIFTAVISGLLWMMVYLFLDRLHGMQRMFNGEFPFLIASILGLHREAMSVVIGTTLAFLDGAFVGFIFSWFLKMIVFHSLNNNAKKGE
ncbi:MAG: hypothetical protein KGJ59_02390 [Bacteroidota bacterium]|nr:hypothetical protein [Bacteroidota bacterium]